MHLTTGKLKEELEDLLQMKADLKDGEELDGDDAERLALLRKLDDEIDGGLKEEATLIADGKDWRDYCQDMAESMGSIARDSPLSCYVDWDGWADACASDYTTVEFDGVTYYVVP